MVIVYKKWKKWNSIDKKQNGLEQSKNYKSSTLPQHIHYKYLLKIAPLKLSFRPIRLSKKEVPFSMAIRNVELMRECFVKVDKDTVADRQKRVNIERGGHEIKFHGLATARATTA